MRASKSHGRPFVFAVFLIAAALIPPACNSTDINTPNHFNRPHRNPSITVDCPASVGENAATTCALTARHNDLQARFLTCSLNPATTCTGVTLTGCTSANVPAQGEDRGSQSCSVVVDVKDDYFPPHSGQGRDTITIDEENQNPTMSGDCPANFGENSAATCVLTVSDLDLPLQTLTCSSGGTSCVGFTPEVSGSGGNPQNCTISLIPADPQVCSLRVVGTDNGSPALSVGQTITITMPNRAPIWATTPGNITITSGSVYNQTNGVLTDPDTGQTLACSTSATSCVGFSPTYTGSGTSPVNCTLAFTTTQPETCNIRLVGTDNGTPAASVGTTITISVIGVWTWMSGSNLLNQYGVYGTKGVPDPANVPGARVNAVSWTNDAGHLWLFGGHGYAASGSLGDLNDLWRWDGANWTWMSGSNAIFKYGVYGAKGVPASANVPGARSWAISWTDDAGNLWLFGGYGIAASGGSGCLNDLWRWDGVNWTWISGSNSISQLGVYGTKGVPASANVPGARYGAVSWTDAAGNFWFFSGYGYDASGSWDYLNDLWRWDGVNWTWISGSNAINQNGVYGAKDVPDPANIPGARSWAISWTDAAGNLWLFGGAGFAASGAGYLNDIWRWDGVNWTWISGSNAINQPGGYGTKGVPDSANVPGARRYAFSWTDATGNLWLFGGDGYAASGGGGILNDLWKWDDVNWTWMSGSNAINQYAVYGTKGVPDPVNVPGARLGAISWTDATGNLWLFGGAGFAASGSYGYLNDLWIYSP